MNRRSLLAAIGGLFLVPCVRAEAASSHGGLCRSDDGELIIDFHAGEIKVVPHLAAGSVRADHIAVGSITASRIAGGTIRTDQIRASAISARKIIISKEN